jgi:hypothetical protein
MVQARPAGDPAPDVVKGKAGDGAEEEWAVLSPLDRAEIVSARIVVRPLLTLPDSPVIREAAPNVVRK